MLCIILLTPWHSDILLQFTADAGIHFIHACCKVRWVPFPSDFTALWKNQPCRDSSAHARRNTIKKDMGPSHVFFDVL